VHYSGGRLLVRLAGDNVLDTVEIGAADQGGLQNGELVCLAIGDELSLEITLTGTPGLQFGLHLFLLDIVLFGDGDLLWRNAVGIGRSVQFSVAVVAQQRLYWPL